MLSFTFDNDAIKHLVDRDDFELIWMKCVDASYSMQQTCFLSQVNFLELLQGTNRKSFVHRQTMLRRFLPLVVCTGRLSLLASPLFIIKEELGLVGQEETQTKTEILGNKIRFYAAVPSYDQLWKEMASEIRSVRVNRWDTFWELRDVATVDKSGADGSRSSREVLENRSEYSTLMVRGMLPDILNGSGAMLTENEALRCSRGLAWFIEMSRSHRLQSLKNNRRVDKGDPFDLARIPYLTICDYVVTDDRSLRELARLSTNSDLRGRLITSDRFRNHLFGDRLDPRL